MTSKTYDLFEATRALYPVATVQASSAERAVAQYVGSERVVAVERWTEEQA